MQIEIGSNNDVVFGGGNASPVHLALCLRQASLWLDEVIDHGQFVPHALR